MIMQVEDFKTRLEVIGQYRIECSIDRHKTLADQNPGSCPGTSFTKLLVECMQREPQFPYRKD
jgi:hypothetical protein